MRTLLCWLVLVMPTLLCGQYIGTAPFTPEKGGLMINEISNGAGGNQEYYEMIVVGAPSNPTAPVNLEGWIIDDNNSSNNSSGRTQGHIAFGSCYRAVPPGSIIVVYNPTDRNVNLPPDDIDDTNPADGVYIIPGNNTTCLNSCNSNPNGANEEYCPCLNPNLVNMSWPLVSNNSGDLFQIRDNCGGVVHAIGWSETASLPVTADVSSSPVFFDIGNGQSQRTIRLNNTMGSNWNDPNNYDNPNASEQTPGSANNADNQLFINAIRAGTFNYSGIVASCRTTDAGDLVAPNNAGGALPIVITPGNNLDAFSVDYSAADRTQPDGTQSGFNFEYGFILTENNPPTYNIIAFNTTSGNFDFSALTEGSYVVWGISYLNKRNANSLSAFLGNNINTIAELQNTVIDDCDVSISLDNRSQSRELMEIIITANCNVSVNKTDVQCPSDATGSIALTITGGTAPLNIDWNVDSLDGSTNATNLTTGTYTVNITDGAACDITETITIDALRPAPQFTAFWQDSICPNACADARVTFVGTSPFRLNYDARVGFLSANFDGIVVGTDTSLQICPGLFGIGSGGVVEVTFNSISDAFCTVALDTTLRGTILESPQINIVDTLCQGNSVFINGTEYNAANPSGQEIILNGASNGCDSIVNVQFTFVNSTLSLSPDITNVTCIGETNGGVNLNITGTTGQVSIDWSVDSLDGQATVQNLAAGIYNVAVIDGSGCTVQETIEIVNQNISPTLNISWQDSICTNDCGDILIQLGGTPPFNIEYSVQVQGINLTDNYTVFRNDTIVTICPSILGLGTNGGQFSATFVSIQDSSCASTVNETFVATVLPIAQRIENPTICASENIIINGNVYNAANPRDTIVIAGVGPAGCDSIIIVDLTIRPLDTVVINNTFCSGETLLVNGVTYDENNPTGVETIIGGGIDGCDSVVNINLSFLPSVSSDLNRSLCAGESLTINGVVYDQANPTGSEILVGAATNGCDSIINVNLIFPQFDTTIFFANICPGGSITVNGNIYDENRLTGVEVFPNGSSGGCDSIVMVNLIVQAQPSLIFNQTDVNCPGETTGAIDLDLSNLTAPFNISWSDSTFNGQSNISGLTNGTYSVEVLDAANCRVQGDIDIVAAHPLPTFNVSFDQAVCQNECGTMVANYTGTPPFNLNYNLRLGLISVDLTYRTSAFDTTLQICPDEFGINAGGTVGATFFSISDANCVNQLDESFSGDILEVAVQNLEGTLCQGETFNLNGTIYDESNPTGMEILPGAGVNGCDSIINVSLTFLPADTVMLARTLCEGEFLLIGGSVYDVNNPSGFEVIAGATQNGCDSIIQVALNFLDASASTSNILIELCEGQDTIINGTLYDANNLIGTEILTGASASGCDSIVNVIVDVLLPPMRILNSTLCEGEFVEINGNVYDASNRTGTERIPNPDGCDSLIVINLDFSPTVSAILIPSNDICFGDSATLTFEFNQTGNFNVRYFEGTIPRTLTDISDGHTLTVNPNATTTYRIESITNVGSCFTLGEPVTINVSNLAVTVNQQNVACEGQNNGSVILEPSRGVEPFSIQWSTGETTATRENLSPGTYDFTVEDAAGCQVQQSVTIEEGNLLAITTSVESAPCFGDRDGSITIEDLSGGTSPYTIQIDETTRTISRGPVVFRNLDFGTFKVAITDARGCTLNETVEIPAPDDLILELGDNLQIGVGDSVQLNALINLNNDRLRTIRWTPATTLSDSSALNPFANPTRTTTYFLVITDENGCTATDQVTIFVSNERKVYIPNIFSPNGDGSNDFFFVQADRKVTAIPLVQIFDRWGNMVYSTTEMRINEESTGWDGNSNGTPLNPATFVYRIVVEFTDGKSETIIGSIDLLR